MKEIILRKVLPCLLVFSFAFSSVAALDLTKTYDKANQMMVAKDFTGAAQLFDSISFYEDSSMLAMYCRANQLAADGNYDKAIEAFESFGDYKDSEYLAIYYEALSYEASADETPLLYQDAFETYDSIYLFKDSAKRAESCRQKLYDYGMEQFENGRFRPAFLAFSVLTGYSDSDRMESISERLLSASYSTNSTPIPIIFDSDAFPSILSILKYDSAEPYYVISTFTGAMGPITMLCEVGSDLKCRAIEILDQTEADGLGAVAASDSGAGAAFRSQFVGEDISIALSTNGGHIDALAGATVTSTAIVNATATSISAVASILNTYSGVGLVGSAEGKFGPVTVSVTADDSQIYSVEVISANETPGIGSIAVEQLPDLILLHQSVDIDGVAGATMTSNAIKQAVVNALKSAGIDTGRYGAASLVESEENPDPDVPSSANPAIETETMPVNYNPGSYTAQATGMGTITVTVTVDEHSILAVEIDGSGETPGIGAAAISPLENQILTSQSAEIDGVAGATLTTNGVKSALGAALELAKAADVPADTQDSGLVMSYAEFVDAQIDDPVCVETYVQAKQSWWEDKATVYAADEDGAYFIYNMACSEDEYAALVPGQKIRVTGYKAEWSGEVEIVDASFELLYGSYFADPIDVTPLLGTDELIKYINHFVSFKGMTVEPYDETGAAFVYKNEVEKSDDLYFKVSKDGITYDFCVEYYLCGEDTPVYQAIENWNVGDVVDLCGFLYWYEGPNPHITDVVQAASHAAQTLRGSAQGINGQITVEVVADETTIYSVEVLEEQETPGIGSIAIETLPVAIVQANSLSVDGVSGATVTSTGLIGAVRSALESAGLDPDSYGQ